MLSKNENSVMSNIYNLLSSVKYGRNFEEYSHDNESKQLIGEPSNYTYPIPQV